MSAETVVRLIEEMIDLKLQQTVQPGHKLSPDVTRMLEQKRFLDRQRLRQIRADLVQLLGGDTIHGADAAVPRANR